MKIYALEEKEVEHLLEDNPAIRVDDRSDVVHVLKTMADIMESYESAVFVVRLR